MSSLKPKFIPGERENMAIMEIVNNFISLHIFILNNFRFFLIPLFTLSLGLYLVKPLSILRTMQRVLECTFFLLLVYFPTCA